MFRIQIMFHILQNWSMGRFNVAMAKADREFSLYVRRRNADPHTGRTQCATCGNHEHWSEMDCGHYITRAVWVTRFDPQNCWAQCRGCNRLENGKPEQFRRFLIEYYGLEKVQSLERKSKRTADNRPSVETLLNIFKIYRQLNRIEIHEF